MSHTLFNNNYAVTGKDVSIKQIAGLLKSEYMRERIAALRDTTCKYERKRLKEQLLCVTFAASFDTRCKAGIQGASGVMLFDYDDIKDEQHANQLIENIRRELGDNLLLAFQSPNHGVKFAVKTDLVTTDNAVFRHVYKCLLAEFEKRLGIVLDRSTCDITRLCNLSYDERTYFNEHAEVIDIDKQIISDFDARQAKLRRITELKHERHMKRHEHVCSKRQRILAEKALAQFRDRDTAGHRHNALFIYAMRLFEAAYSIQQVTIAFRALGGSYTESQSIEKYVQGVFDTFGRTSGVNAWVYRVEEI
ncbi:TPA: BT4734/BF3469 family protein [Vibrio parahaemolyticus]